MRRMIENTKPPDVPVEHPELAYKPKKRTPKIIKEKGKVRKIFMPEIHEQWLHHIIVLILEPIITATAYPYSCGSFPKRGAHFGKKRLLKIIQGGKNIRNFAKIDIRHFYDSIRLDILMRELRIRIKDELFLYVVELCLQGFKKGIPLGFYISQWLANYLLDPLDRFITDKLGIPNLIRYMDDIVLGHDNKKKLHQAIVEIKKFIGRRFRLKLKRNYQVFKFNYQKKDGKVVGRVIDFMGFLFFRNRTTMRKAIMLSATRLASRLHAAKEAGRGYFKKHIEAMLSYIGWFSCTDTYDAYQIYTKMKQRTQERSASRPAELQLVAPDTFIQRRNIQPEEHEATDQAAAYTDFVCESREISVGEYEMLKSIEAIKTDEAVTAAIDEYTMQLMEGGLL